MTGAGIKSSTLGSLSGSDPRHAVELSDPAGFGGAVEAGKILDLQIRGVELRGPWETHPDDDYVVGWGHYCGVEAADSEWFHLEIDGEMVRARPQQSDATQDGSLRILFDVSEENR